MTIELSADSAEEAEDSALTAGQKLSTLFAAYLGSPLTLVRLSRLAEVGGSGGILAGCGKTLLSTQGRKLSDDKRRPIACSERIIRIGLSHAECRRDS